MKRTKTHIKLIATAEGWLFEISATPSISLLLNSIQFNFMRCFIYALFKCISCNLFRRTIYHCVMFKKPRGKKHNLCDCAFDIFVIKASERKRENIGLCNLNKIGYLIEQLNVPTVRFLLPSVFAFTFFSRSKVYVCMQFSNQNVMGRPFL